MEDEVIFNDELGISTPDKIAYKNTLQLIINRALLSMTTTHLHNEVKALETALYFDVEGLNFKKEIDGFKEDLRKLTLEYIEQVIKDKDNGIYYHPTCFEDLNFRDKSATKKKAYFFYWEKLLNFLLDLVAKRDGLLKSKQFVEEGGEG